MTDHHKPRKQPPDLERLRERYSYEADTGLLKRRVNMGPKFKAGTVAGKIDSHGYSVVTIDGVFYKGHHVAWYYVNGVWPDSEMDHINGDRADNRMENLRVCSHRNNMRNRSAQVNNKLGLKGVQAFTTRAGNVRYRARMHSNGVIVPLGCYGTPQEAAEAFRRAERLVYQDFVRA